MTGTSERMPFVEVAARKGLTLRFDDELHADDPAPWDVDVDLARASLANALARARMHGLRELEVRLERLLRDGSAADHVDFAAAYRPVYYFPEDVERLARAGPLVSHPRVAHELAWLRCSPLADGSHHCAEVTRRICAIGDTHSEEVS